MCLDFGVDHRLLSVVVCGDDVGLLKIELVGADTFILPVLPVQEAFRFSLSVIKQSIPKTLLLRRRGIRRRCGW